MIVVYLYDTCEQVGDTALMMAAQGGQHQCVSILVASSADVNIVNNVSCTMRRRCHQPGLSHLNCFDVVRMLSCCNCCDVELVSWSDGADAGIEGGSP